MITGEKKTDKNVEPKRSWKKLHEPVQTTLK